MIYVDEALLNLIEGACRRFQRLTGLTNVWLAFQLTNLSIVVYFVLAAVYFWSSPVVGRIALVLFCGGLLYLLTQTIFKVTVEAHARVLCTCGTPPRCLTVAVRRPSAS